jgi:alkaline phosphatase
MKRGILMASLAALLLAACDDGKDGMDGNNGTNGLNSLVATRILAKGDATCAGGGTVLESGLDTNRNA